MSLWTTVNNESILQINLQSCYSAIARLAKQHISKKDHLFGIHQYFDELGRICPLIIFDDC